ncbi:class I SAM-dependent methyltransferase [Nonomuraea polychroma]|uniref:class I SAM-dependent methyltransferase n=1 Tax=Nonomuraea polychroma TaxID=46176 RepID=UPI003D940F53
MSPKRHGLDAAKHYGEDQLAVLMSLIALLDIGDNIPGAVELRARSYKLLGIAPDAAMAEQGARAVGVDLDERMVAVVGRRWPAADFRVTGVYELPFADGELHGYRAEKVYHVLDDPTRAAGEAERMLARGGPTRPCSCT